jgi:DNA modification methylase
VNYKLYHGDCLEVVPEFVGKVNLILTDIPFGTTKCKWDSIIPLDNMWDMLEFPRCIDTPILLFGQAPFDKILGASNIEELKYEWIWEKTSATGYLNAKKMPMKAHESILVFYRKLPHYDPQKTTGHTRKVSTAKHKRNSTQTEVYNKHGLTTYNSTERYPRSVLKFPTDKQKSSYHPTQKPVALLEYLIRTYTKEGDTVLDFTCGSGSTGVACRNMDRNFIGIDNGYCEKEGNFKGMKWIDVAKWRIENE